MRWHSTSSRMASKRKPVQGGSRTLRLSPIRKKIEYGGFFNQISHVSTLQFSMRWTTSLAFSFHFLYELLKLWNIVLSLLKLCGITNTNTFNRIQDLIKKHKPSMMCLMETTANANRVFRTCRRFSSVWEWTVIPTEGLSKGIIVVYHRSIGVVTPLAISRDAIHLVISSKTHDVGF